MILRYKRIARRVKTKENEKKKMEMAPGLLLLSLLSVATSWVLRFNPRSGRGLLQSFSLQSNSHTYIHRQTHIYLFCDTHCYLLAKDFILSLSLFFFSFSFSLFLLLLIIVIFFSMLFFFFWYFQLI